MRRFALFCLLATALNSAPDGWQFLKGGEIEAALSERKLEYSKGEWQIFYPSGRTLYNAGRDSWGYWQVREDEYCSKWPPSGLWECYKLAQKGEMLRFIGRAADITEGRYAD